MKRIVTSKYAIFFEGLETLTTEMVITKKEFEKQLKKLKIQCEQSKNNPDFEIDYNMTTNENPQLIQISHFFTIATSSIILVEQHTKDGYCFN